MFVALTSVSCVTGMVITGLFGICKGDNCVFQENQDENYRIAISIVVSIGIVLLTCVLGLILLCTHGSYFGITLFTKNQNRISDTSSSPVSATGIGPFFIPTGQEEDDVRRNHAELGLSLQTQLQRQNEIDAAKRMDPRQSTSSIPELPPIRGGQNRQMFLYDEWAHSSQFSQSDLPAVFQTRRPSRSRSRATRSRSPSSPPSPSPPPPPQVLRQQSAPPRPPIRIPTAWMSSSDNESLNESSDHSPPPPYTP